MIISPQREWLFIHVWKTGGTSVDRALRQEFEINPTTGLRQLADRATLIWRRAQGLPVLGKHAYAVDVRDRLGESYGRCFSFAFVRNPWDWLVSWYHFVRNTRTSPDTGAPWRHHLQGEVEGMSFEEFVDWVVGGGLEQAYSRQHSSFRGRSPMLQRDWLSDLNGDVIVDFVGRFERFAEDFGHIAERLGRPSLTLPHVNRSVHAGYRAYYTPGTRDAVAEYFSGDIETFGYEF